MEILNDGRQEISNTCSRNSLTVDSMLGRRVNRSSPDQERCP